MTKRPLMFLLLTLAASIHVAGQAPSGSAQWAVDSGPVYSANVHRLFNIPRDTYLTAGATGDLSWKFVAAGQGTVMFENCTRPGEVVYGSDRVAIRFGSRFLIATGPSGRGWTSDRQEGCQFRLIPSGSGFVTAGSGNGAFAIYNIVNNRYLVFKGSLIWQVIGGSPGGQLASADFVPVELFFTVGSFAGKPTQGTYLTIKNVGNVRTSASQREMKIRVKGQPIDFLVVQSVAPGDILRNPIRLNSPLSNCEKVLVELDTSDLKFQALESGLPNNSIFANDRVTLTARRSGAGNTKVEIPCDPAVSPR